VLAGRAIHLLEFANVATIFLAYPFTDMPDLFEAVKRASVGIADVHCATTDWESLHLLEKVDNQMKAADLALFDVTTWNVNVAVEYGIARKAGYNHRLLFCSDPVYEGFRKGRPSVFSDIAGVDSLHYKDLPTLEQALRGYLPNAIKRTHATPDIGVRPNLTLEITFSTIPGQGLVLEGSLRNQRAVAYEVRYRIDGLEIERQHGRFTIAIPQPIRVGTVAPGETKTLRHTIEREPLGRRTIDQPRVYFEYRDENGIDYRQQGWLRLKRTDDEASYVFGGLGPPEVIKDKNEILIPLVYM